MNFQIETTSFCNLTCPECPNRVLQRKRTFMTDEVWNTIVNKYIGPYRYYKNNRVRPTVIPHKDGEPLLDKKLRNRIEHVSRLYPDVSFSIYTNGLLLKREFIEFLGTLRNHVRLLVSFHFFNHDGSTNNYAPVSTLLRKCIHEFKPPNVELIFASHLMPPATMEMLEEWAASWRPEVSTGRLTVHANVRINPWTGLIDGNQLHGHCPYDTFEGIFFGVTGNVIACCMDLEEEIVFGNVLTEDPAKMVGSVEAFYAAQRRREVNHSVCNNCFGLPTTKTKLIPLGIK